MGGDEFVVLFEGVPVAMVRERMVVAKWRFWSQVKRLGNDTTLSFGVVSMSAEPATFRDLLEAADREMYAQKQRSEEARPTVSAPTFAGRDASPHLDPHRLSGLG